jgi:ferric-dicitrate binding protein FerR (iron transport regulator)
MMEQLTEEEKFLLLGKVTGTLSPEEEHAVEQLFLTNPHARAAYDELTGALPMEEVATQFARRKENPTWRDLKTELQQRKQPRLPEIKRIPFYKKKWAAAAAITIGILAAGTVLWNQFGKSDNRDLAELTSKPAIELKLANGQVVNLSQAQGTIDAGAAQLNNSNKSLSYSVNNDEAVAGINTLTVPIGLDYKISLADGSEVWLNSATRLDFPLAFPGNTREITVNGEAYLKVAKNAAKPFIVHLPHSTVQVLGTEFNVNTYDSGLVKVALVEGSVNMQAPTGASKLAPGRQAIYRSGQSISQETFDARSVLSWRKGLFYFSDASLKEISKVLPRWYGIQVTIDDPTILSRTFSGVIDRNKPIQVFMGDLKMISRIDSYVDEQNVLHFK